MIRIGNYHVIGLFDLSSHHIYLTTVDFDATKTFGRHSANVLQKLVLFLSLQTACICGTRIILDFIVLDINKVHINITEISLVQ